MNWQIALGIWTVGILLVIAFVRGTRDKETKL